MGYIAQITCKSRELARMTGELLAKYYPDSTGNPAVEEECWEICHINRLIADQKIAKPEIIQNAAEDIPLVSGIEQWDGAVVSLMKCKFSGYYDEELLHMIIQKCGCKVRSKFDEKVDCLVIDFSEVTSKSLPSILKKIQQVKEKNSELKVLSYTDFLAALLLRIGECTAPIVSCTYGRFEGDEPEDCLEVSEDGVITVTCPCGLDSDDAYRLAEEDGGDVEDYMFLIDEEGGVYAIAHALMYLIPRMDRTQKWRGNIENASVLTKEESEVLSLLGDMVEIEEEKYCYSRTGWID